MKDPTQRFLRGKLVLLGVEQQVALFTFTIVYLNAIKYVYLLVKKLGEKHLEWIDSWKWTVGKGQKPLTTPELVFVERWRRPGADQVSSLSKLLFPSRYTNQLPSQISLQVKYIIHISNYHDLSHWMSLLKINRKCSVNVCNCISTLICFFMCYNDLNTYIIPLSLTFMCI